MQNNQPLLSINIDSITPSYIGKVRTIYDLQDKMLIVATDRVSAFDIVFNEGISNKGKILTNISNQWFSYLDFPNHIIATNSDDFPEPFCKHGEILSGRSVLVNKAKRIDVECIVRGFLLGSGFQQYQQTNSISGIALPKGMQNGDKFAEPIFTPTTKADKGNDMPITFAEMENLIGKDISAKLQEASIRLYQQAYDILYKQNIMLLDTKLEFGIVDNQIILIDEIFTPDSSRFCDKEEFENSKKQSLPVPSLDKEIIRSYLKDINWNKKPPAPSLPSHILDKTLQKYQYIEEQIACALKQK